ncbi:putative rnase h domain protein [Golovinomyces cichoracearum]|uniref:ribonuclease H n=1 Tax=Golovinomyces cichoracearum TaxID=62708 RepID=A0A420J176_9PEZI|nr:putative rnase h domain protein [Golovinomyces cichoracearum]
MEVLLKTNSYNFKPSLLHEQGRLSVGNFLQYSDRTFQEQSPSGKNLGIQTSNDVSSQHNIRASSYALYTDDRRLSRAVYRASTGNLPHNSRTLPRALQTNHRASTGGLKPSNSRTTRGNYHHILARDLKQTNPTVSEHKNSDKKVEAASHCNRCTKRIKTQFFECLNCPSFKLCAECGDGGIYCQDDTHSWVEKSPLNNRSQSQVIGKISYGEARTLYYGTKTFPTIFLPPSPLDTPEDLFNSEHRFIRKTDPREIMIYANGACIRSSNAGSIAGWAFVYRPSAYTQDGTLTHAGTISGRLEMKGPTGKIYKTSSNRAELRSAIAALQFLDWSKDCNRGWRSVVIATDSEYVICSVTKWIAEWEDTNWKLDNQRDVNNKDLWELLLEEVRRYHAEGVKIAFWRIPRHFNTRACEFAKKATGRGYKERLETVKFQPDGPVKVRVTPFRAGINEI